MPSNRLPPGLFPGGRFAQWQRQPVEYVVLDVDGTLVGAHDVLRPDVIAAIAATGAAGLPVGYATGRMQAALADIDAVLCLPGPHVVHNGAKIRQHNKTVASWPLSPADVQTVVQLSADLDAYAELYLDEGFLVTARDPRAKVHWDLLGQEPLGLADELAGREVTKATFIAFTNDDAHAFIAGIERAGMAPGPAGSLLTPGLTYINATAKGVDKAAALATAAELVGTDLAHTLAVGDGGNDLSMLSVAGTAVAMGQASDEVKAAAHLVTTHVDEGGLALALTALAMPG